MKTLYRAGKKFSRVELDLYHPPGFGSKTWQVFETCQVSFLLTSLPPLQVWRGGE